MKYAGGIMVSKSSGSLIKQAWWLLSHRPTRVYQLARGYALFLLARGVRAVWTNPGITLGKNVRLQKNSSLMAEAPGARITIGEHSVIYEDTAIEAYGAARVVVGSSAMLGGLRIVSRYGVSIGERFLSSWGVFIQDYDSHPVAADLRGQQVQLMVSNLRPRFDGGAVKPPPLEGWDFPGETITIGNDVWIGANCTILKGAHIGDGCVVATGAVVLRGTFPGNSLIAGNPAVVVKSLNA